MTQSNFKILTDEIKQRQEMIRAYLFAEETRLKFSYQHLEDAVLSYVRAGGKSLRPAVLMFACGAVGGDEQTAIPAAAAVELFHTFTLVHDDIIDRDTMRRGVPTVHHDFMQRGIKDMGFDEHTAQHYGLAVAILSGDLQQGWAASIMPDLYYQHGLPPELALHLSRRLFRHVSMNLMNGETVDVMQAWLPVDQLSEEDVLQMLWEKTGILYEFTGTAGAAIGLKHPNFDHPLIQAVGNFTGRCGIAFQLQDDILGVTGDATRMGKAVGADIREGKRTIIVLHSLPKMQKTEREFTMSVLGNQEATPEQITEVVGLLEKYGGIDHAKSLAARYIEEGLASLNQVDESKYKSLLVSWADFVMQRQR